MIIEPKWSNISYLVMDALWTISSIYIYIVDFGLSHFTSEPLNYNKCLQVLSFDLRQSINVVNVDFINFDPAKKICFKSYIGKVVKTTSNVLQNKIKQMF